MNFGMGKAYKSGLMAQYMTATGCKERLKAKESYIMLMVTYTKVSGLTIKRMVREAISTKMVLNTLVSGKMISIMDLVMRVGQTMQFMKVNILKE